MFAALPLAVDPSGILDRLSVAAWIFDIDHGQVVWANRSGLELWRAEDIAALAVRDMNFDMSASVARRLRQYQDDFVRKQSVFSELWTLYPGGVARTVRVLFSGIRLADGRMAMFCEAQDEVEMQPDTLRSTEALLHTQLMISLQSIEGDALYRNPAARAAVGNDGDHLKLRCADVAEYEEFAEELERSGEVSRVVRMRTQVGIRWHEVTARQCHDAVTGKPAILISEVDVSELKDTEAKAHFLAYHDTLTGLPNRASVRHQFGQCIRWAEIRGQELGVFFLDLDNFKLINDSLGHAVGDEVLVEVARRLVALAHRGEITIRLGGDEFLIIVSGESRQAHEQMARKMLEVLASPILIGPRSLTVTTSIGISVFPQDGTDSETLMKCADLAMYDAKAVGRNCFRSFCVGMRERADSRLNLQSDIKAAIANDEFEVYYQPRVSVQDISIVGAEALVRWNHPTRGMILPSLFIPICEETGSIEELGAYVMRAAMRQQKTWHDLGYPISVSINVSQRQLSNGDFVTTVENALAETGCEPGLIELELTESMLMERSDSSAEIIDTLRCLGVKISIDDFGTGYSNLARLHEFAIDCVKIDRTFIQTLPHDEALAKLIISLGKLMNVKIVAEGVESLEQLIWLKGRGCEEFQGFYFSKPIPAKMFGELLLGYWIADRTETGVALGSDLTRPALHIPDHRTSGDPPATTGGQPGR